MNPNRILIDRKPTSSDPGSFSLGIQMRDEKVIYLEVDNKIQCYFKNANDYLRKDKKEIILVDKSFFSDSMKTPNVFRYVVKRINSQVFFYSLPESESDYCNSNFSDYKLSRENSLKSIVLLLESPHMDEYNYSCGIPSVKGPAQGKTGQNIFNKLDELFFNEELLLSILDNEIEYRILIVNPIPFQTSLHFFHRQRLVTPYTALRNKVWKALWINDLKFKSELLEILKNLTPESIVLNCCTSDLSPMVSNELIANNVLHFNLSHPSYWNKGFNLKKKMKVPNITYA